MFFYFNNFVKNNNDLIPIIYKIHNFLSRYFIKIKNIDTDFWGSIYSNDLEEVNNV